AGEQSHYVRSCCAHDKRRPSRPSSPEHVVIARLRSKFPSEVRFPFESYSYHRHLQRNQKSNILLKSASPVDCADESPSLRTIFICRANPVSTLVMPSMISIICPWIFIASFNCPARLCSLERWICCIVHSPALANSFAFASNIDARWYCISASAASMRI